MAAEYRIEQKQRNESVLEDKFALTEETVKKWRSRLSPTYYLTFFEAQALCDANLQQYKTIEGLNKEVSNLRAQLRTETAKAERLAAQCAADLTIKGALHCLWLAIKKRW